MRRTVLLFAAVALLLAMVAIPIAAAQAARITVRDIAEIYGVVAEPGELLEEALFDDAFLRGPWRATERRRGVLRSRPLGDSRRGLPGANIVDNVLPH